jgi:hypothetical protein
VKALAKVQQAKTAFTDWKSIRGEYVAQRYLISLLSDSMMVDRDVHGLSCNLALYPNRSSPIPPASSATIFSATYDLAPELLF